MGNDYRIEACLATDLLVAWRLFHLARMGRGTPEVPCTAFFEEDEWRALVSFHDRVPVALEATPPTLQKAIRMVASLGGFLGRKGDGEPGTETLWRGAAARRYRRHVDSFHRPAKLSRIDCAQTQKIRVKIKALRDGVSGFNSH